jgi:hypothetical protein
VSLPDIRQEIIAGLLASPEDVLQGAPDQRNNMASIKAAWTANDAIARYKETFNVMASLPARQWASTQGGPQ